MSLKHEIFRRRDFDYLLVDEASQAIPSAVFGALKMAKKFVLFGDPCQLPSIIQEKTLKYVDI
jgi:DNA replication ATP-dependent helicase Dna2